MRVTLKGFSLTNLSCENKEKAKKEKTRKGLTHQPRKCVIHLKCISFFIDLKQKWIQTDQIWIQYDTNMNKKWIKNETIMDPIWNKYGTILKQIWNQYKTNMEPIQNKYRTNKKQILCWYFYLLQFWHHSTRCQILQAWILREERDCVGSENIIIIIIIIIITIALIFIIILPWSKLVRCSNGWFYTPPIPIWFQLQLRCRTFHHSPVIFSSTIFSSYLHFIKFDLLRFLFPLFFDQ